jgi:sarcosine oxidase
LAGCFTQLSPVTLYEVGSVAEWWQMKFYDIAIIGLGTMGSFVAMELARRRLSVAGFDQFTPPHHHGSHSGETRVFRIAYCEHPNYVPLAQRSGLFWERLSEELGKPLLTRCGLLSMGPEDAEIISGIRRSAELYQLPIETLSSDEVRKRYPALQPPDHFVGLLERSAGWIDVEPAIQEALKQSRGSGADLFLETPVLSWESSKGQVVLKTKQGTVLVQKLLITAGAWACQILIDLKLPLTVKRKILTWVDPLVPEYFRPGDLPMFAFAPNFLYGFPNIGGRGVKVAEHVGGNLVGTPFLTIAPPTSEELTAILAAASQFVPSLAGPAPGEMKRVIRAQTCLYTMTPDEHFIIDQHPHYENVYFAAGFSGHGFKFAPVVAEALADLAMEGKTPLPIDFLRLAERSWNR